MRRRDFVAVLAGVGLFAGAGPARAADYPNRSVRVLVPYPAGGPTDLIARLAAQMLTESFGQDFFVENVSGGSGVRGALMVAAAPADGYTLMVTTSDLAIAPVMSSKVSYDPVKNFAPISIISRSPSVLLLHPSVGKDRPGVCDAGARGSCKIQLRIDEPGPKSPEHRKTFSAHLEASGCPHPLPRCGTHSQLDGGRSYARRLYRAPFGNTVHQGRHAPCAGGQQLQAVSHCAGRPDHGGERPRRPGIRAGDRVGRPGRDAAVNRGSFGAPDGGVRCQTANAGTPRRVRLCCGRQYAGGICRPDQIRY